MVYAEILAGGIGTRVGNKETPKQYIALKGKPIIIYTLESIMKEETIDKIIICCQKEWQSHVSKLLKEYFPNNTKIEICDSGDTRSETIITGCNYIKSKYGINEDDIILITDSVRMFTSKEILSENILMAKKFGAVTTMVPAYETIMESLDGKIIDNIPLRNKLYIGQSPQTFNLSKLYKYYNLLTDDEKKNLTECGKIFIKNKEKVFSVMGSFRNFKITYEDDILLAEQYINNKL